MKSYKKILFLSLLFACILRASEVMLTQASENIPKLKENKKTIYIGDYTYQIPLVNTNSKAVISYKSNNIAVKVDSKGSVTPISTGSVVITVTVNQNGKKYTLKTTITVKKTYIFITNKISKMTAGHNYDFTIKSAGLKVKLYQLLIWEYTAIYFALIINVYFTKPYLISLHNNFSRHSQVSSIRPQYFHQAFQF